MKSFRLEKHAVEWFTKMARSKGALVQKLQLHFTVGFPDLLVVYQGMTVFYEFKREGSYPTALQWATLKKLADAGANAYVITAVSREKFLVQHPTIPGAGRWVKPSSPLLWLDPDSMGTSAENGFGGRDMA